MEPCPTVPSGLLGGKCSLVMTTQDLRTAHQATELACGWLGMRASGDAFSDPCPTPHPPPPPAPLTLGRITLQEHPGHIPSPHPSMPGCPRGDGHRCAQTWPESLRGARVVWVRPWLWTKVGHLGSTSVVGPGSGIPSFVHVLICPTDSPRGPHHAPGTALRTRLRAQCAGGGCQCPVLASHPRPAVPGTQPRSVTRTPTGGFPGLSAGARSAAPYPLLDQESFWGRKGVQGAHCFCRVFQSFLMC